MKRTGRPAEMVCKKGHNKTEPYGMMPDGRCGECRRASNRDSYRRTYKRKTA